MQTSFQSTTERVEATNQSQSEEMQRVMSRLENLEAQASKDQIAGAASAARVRTRVKRDGPEEPELQESAKFQKVIDDSAEADSKGAGIPTG